MASHGKRTGDRAHPPAPGFGRVDEPREPFVTIVRRVQANVRRYVPDDTNLARELSEDRRREAAEE